MSRRLAFCAMLPFWLVSQASAQNGPAFDFGVLQLPPGFLDLSDVTISSDATGLVVATAATRLGNAEALALISANLPFGGGARRLTVGIKPTRWSITEAIPALANPVLDNLTFDKVALVISDHEGTRHSSTLDAAEFEFYQEVYKSDDFTLVLKPGINLIAAIPAEGLEPGHPLITVMDALGIEKGTILLQGALGRSLTLLGAAGAGAANVLEDLYLRAELPPMRPPGSPEWFRSGQLALELTGAPSVRLVGEMNVFIDEDELKFYLAAALARSGMSLAGGLASEDGWEQPFGIPWLILHNVALALGISPLGVTPGFAAKMVIGEKDIDVAIAMTFSPAGVPTSMMFKGESEAGFGLSDLMELQARMASAREVALKASGSEVTTVPAIPLDALPGIDFRRIGLQFAPQDAPELNVERGMKIKGEMWLPLSSGGEMTRFASVDAGVTEDGFWARGSLGAFTLGPLVWDDAELDLTATRDAQHLLVKGDVELFGARQAIDLRMSREQPSFRTQTRLYDMFSADISVRSAFNLQRPDFQVDAVAAADFGDAIGPLMQQGIVAFAAAGANVLAGAREASRAAEQALGISQATVDELRRVLETQRRAAFDAVTAASNTANAHRGEMNRALAARNNAWNTYRALPALPAQRKAQALAAYHAVNAAYLRDAAAYNASIAALAVAQRVYNAIPPVNENIHLLRAEAALAELRDQLRAVQTNVAALESRYGAINAAIARGEQILVVERAEFHGGLQSAMNGDPIRWDIVGRFAGQRFEVHETMDFSNAGEGAARMLQALLNQ